MARHAVSHHTTSCTAPAPNTITSSPSPSQTPTRPKKYQERWQRDRRTRSPGKTNSSTLLRTRNRHQHPPPTVAMIYIPHMPAHNSATHSPMPEIAAYADTHTHISANMHIHSCTPTKRTLLGCETVQTPHRLVPSWTPLLPRYRGSVTPTSPW